MQTINRQALAKRIHANAVAKGFWPTNEDGAHKYSPEHYGMLVITELSEAVEAHRKNNHACRESYEINLQTQGEARKDELFGHYIKDSVEDEIADAYIRLLDMWGAYCSTSIDEAIEEWKERFSETDWGLSEFTEDIYAIISNFYDTLNCFEIKYKVSYILRELEDLAEYLGIDLFWHVQEKMRYNESRPPLHGKEY